jgi:hypothetical protein
VKVGLWLCASIDAEAGPCPISKKKVGWIHGYIHESLGCIGQNRACRQNDVYAARARKNYSQV